MAEASSQAIGRCQAVEDAGSRGNDAPATVAHGVLRPNGALDAVADGVWRIFDASATVADAVSHANGPLATAADASLRAIEPRATAANPSLHRIEPFATADDEPRPASVALTAVADLVIADASAAGPPCERGERRDAGVPNR